MKRQASESKSSMTRNEVSFLVDSILDDRYLYFVPKKHNACYVFDKSRQDRTLHAFGFVVLAVRMVQPKQSAP